MKKWITFLLILIMLIAVFFIAISISSPKDNGNDESGDNLNINNDKTTGNVVKDDSGSNSISGNAAGGGGSGGGSGGSSGGAGSGSETGVESLPERELPSDLNTRPCGFYFVEYDVCAGVCPEGQCLVNGKSCYCRIV